MKGKIISGVTPQQKMVAVNNRFGNSNIAQQQGTTRVLFDSLRFGTNTEFRFFENVGSRQYPFTNVGSEGNRLNVGDTFVVQKIYFAYALIDPDTKIVSVFQPGFPPTASMGEFSFQIANSEVIKQLPLSVVAGASTNPTCVNSADVAFDTFTDIVIPPLLEYTLTVRLAQPATGLENFVLQCFIEGSAGIIAPQTTF